MISEASPYVFRPTVRVRLWPVAGGRQWRNGGLLVLFCLNGWAVVAQSEREWEITRTNRLIAQKEHLTDSLKRSLEGNSIVWLSYGNYFIPEAEAVTETNTYFNMRNSHKVFSFGFDHFMTNQIAVGLELGFHAIKQTMDLSGTRIKGGGGLISTTTVQLKYFFSPIHFAPARRLYMFFGSGFAQTVVVSINATVDFSNPGKSPNPKIFLQSTSTINGGIGMIHRLSKYIAADLSMRYVHSYTYSPYIGSVRSFSPFQIDIKLGGVLHAGFRRAEKQLNP